MLNVPVSVDISTGEAQAALRDLENGIDSTLKKIIDLDGKKLNFEYVFTTSGTKVLKELSDQDVAVKKLAKSQKNQIVVQDGSIAATRQSISLLKKQRDGLNRSNPAWAEYGNRLKQAEGKLKALQGIQAGSLADLREQRAELVQLRDAVKTTSPQFDRLSKEIEKLDLALGKTKPKTTNFFNTLTKFAGKVAVFSAAFTAVSAGLRSVGNAAGVYVARAKEIESFNLAIRNVGYTQAETNRVFQQAATTANSLGAPIQQVEKSYKRMIPALEAVGTSADESDRFIASISARSATLGLNSEQSGRLLEAFAQVLSKGKLQAEELNQQISELDGAFRTQFADALGVTTQALNELISDSQITADVFVKTVNKMQNGIEALQKRVKDANLTIQQFQNLIANLDVKTVEEVGKAIEPAVKAFLQIRLAVAEFLNEFTNTAQFENIVVVINQTAKGLEVLIKNVLAAIEAFNNFTAPLFKIINFLLGLGDGFGGLIGILINSAAAFFLVSKAIAGIQFARTIPATIKASRTFRVLRVTAYRTGKSLGYLRGQILGVGSAAQKSTATVARYGQTVSSAGVAASGAGAKIGGFLKEIGSFIAISIAIDLISKLIEMFQASAKAAEELRRAYSGVTSELESGLEELTPKVEKAKDAQEELSGSIADNVKKTNDAGKANASWAAGLAVVAGGAALVAATVLSGGAALGVYIAAAGAAAVASNRAYAATQELAKSGEGLALLKENLKFDSLLLDAQAAAKKLGVELGQIDFSNLKDENLEDAATNIKLTTEALRGKIAADKELLKAELARENPRKAEVEFFKKNIKLNSELLAFNEKSLEAISAEIVARIKAGSAAAKQAASLKELKEATKQLNQEIEIEKIEAQTAAIERYGKSAADASLLAASNIGIERAASEERSRVLNKELSELNRRKAAGAALSKEESDRIRELTQLTATESKKQAQLEIDARNAVIDAFEDGIRKTQQEADILGSAASGLKSTFDGVADGLTSGIRSATGLIDEVVNREIRGLDVGNAKRRQIIERQLKAQAVANQAEFNIAAFKLNIQNKIAQSEARIARLRLLAEAKIAQSRGETGLAQAYVEAANLQGAIIKGSQLNYNLELQSLKLNKQRQDQALINKGLEEKIGLSAGFVAEKIGVQAVNLKDAEASMQRFVGQSRAALKEFADLATKTQYLKENTELGAVDQGAKDAKEVKAALNGAQGAVSGINTVMAAVNTQFGEGAESTKRIYGYLQAAVGEAGRLQKIVLSGTAPARAMGGPVAGGKQYTVNDGGGREGFLSNSGKFSMLPAARNIKWTAPTSGTVIPASMVGDFLSAASTDRINKASALSSPKAFNSNLDSGNLVKQMTAALSGSGGNQRITNNVTIQSQQPVTDASQIMTNVARMRLRNSRRI